VSTELAPFIAGLQFMYNAVGHSNYQQILDTIDAYPLSEEQKSDLKSRFPRPSCVAPAVWESPTEEEDFTESFATDPRDPGPLSEYQNHGWVDDFGADTLRENEFYKSVQQRTGISDLQVLEDIRENTLHVLGRCNNPNDWGENKQGLVYGMVQSGKTASMINLISMGIISGYRLFIILAGDKDSLRKQTQKRVNDAFNLSNGVNTETRIHSPTFKDDFSHTGFDYTGTFNTQKMARTNEQYTTIIVMKKWTSHIEDLIEQIKALDNWCSRSRGKFELAENFPALILDDEADYASQNTNPLGDPSATHSALVSLRKTIPRNCYAAYTATPQACLSANPNDLIGYPKDFFWLLEPFKEEVNGRDVNRSYLGAWDVFWEYDDHLVKQVGPNEWPHYEKDDDSGKAQTWIPGKGKNQEGYFANEANLEEAQRQFLEEVANKIRPIPPSLISSLIDFVISAGVRWWDYWDRKDTSGKLPGISEVSKSYPHHAIMIHLSRLNEHQLLARTIVENAWNIMKEEWSSFDINNSPTDHPFQKRWADQKYRTQRLKPDRKQMRFDELSHFIQFAIEIAETPIRQDIAPYKKYEGNPFTYLVNSDEESGMRLYYDEDDPWEIQTNRAAIIVGGQILSRGLTIEGLTVSFFGRTAKMPMGDTVLQMGRWFGHKKSYIDLISIYMQDGLRILFRHIAEADRYLRVQIKDAIFRDLKPEEVLLELRNSPQFRATSPSKSRFVHFGKSAGFSGRRALLREPMFSIDAIKYNNKRLRDFQLKFHHRSEEVHNRAQLYRNIPAIVVISLLNDLKCKSTATQDSFSDYARYLKDWVDDENLPQISNINIAIMNDYDKKRKRELSISKPESSEQARSSITGRYGAIVGGAAHGLYRGDYFLDKAEDWHADNFDAKSTYVRKYGKDDILLVFYRLNPNYVTSRLWDKTDTDEVNTLGKWRHELVELEDGDKFYIDVPKGKEKEHSILVFAAFTPRGGPQYGFGVNTLLDPAKIKQRGLRNYQEELLDLEDE
jgi:hypothetical protein